MNYKKVKKYIPTKELKEKYESFMLSKIMKNIKQFEKLYDLDLIEKIDSFFIDHDNNKNYLQEKLMLKEEIIMDYKEPNYENIDEAIEYCKRTLLFLEKNKKYFYDLGEALYFIKQRYECKKEFINDMEKILNKKSAIIFKYISFYILVKECNFNILNCSLSFREIINNEKTIREILKKL